MSPLWQLKQVITIDKKCYINGNLAFGSSRSPGIFISFNSLVAWIAKYVKFIEYILDYVNNSSGCNLQGDTLYYEPYDMHFPKHQTQLLLLWDELGIPHKLRKQVNGNPLTIISINVDTQKMTLTLPDNAKKRLVDELKFWIQKPPKLSSGSFKLKYWEQMAGWFNWALNMYPLLHPALNNVYTKTTRK